MTTPENANPAGSAPMDAAAREALFDDLYRKHRAEIYNYICQNYVRFVPDGAGSYEGMRKGGLTRDDAEDVTEQVFEKLWKQLLEHAAPNQPRSWLFEVAKNAIIDWVRTRPRESAPASSLEAGPHTVPAAAQVVDHGTSTSAPGQMARVAGQRVLRVTGPATQMARREDIEALRRALETLRPDDRRILEMADVEGMGYKEIAETFGLTVHAIEQRVLRVRRIVQDYMARNAGSTYLADADAWTQYRERPTSREQAIRAFERLPEGDAPILQRRHGNGESIVSIARSMNLPLREAQDRLERAEMHFKRRYSMRLDELVAVLAKAK